MIGVKIDLVNKSMFHLLLVLFKLTQAAEPLCHALALEGGGSRGAYQAGALVGLTTLLPGADLEWNVVTGISTGALNSGLVAQFPMGEEAAMAQYAAAKWRSLNGSSSVFIDYEDCDTVCAILTKPSLYSTDPLRATLTDFYTYGIRRNITVGSTNLDLGQFSDFNESVGNSSIIEAVMCSAAPPFFFPSQYFEGYNWADGGCITNLDVFKAVERCLDVVSEESQVVVDMIFCEGKEMAPLQNGVNFTTNDVFTRSKDIRSYDKSMWYLYNAIQAYPDVNFRYIIIPSKPLAGGVVPFDFTASNLEAELAQGQADAQTVISNGNSAEMITQEWYQRTYNKARAYSGSR